MPSPLITKDTRKAMKLNTVEGAFAVASDNLAGPYLSLFALALGASPSQIGMLSAFPNFLGNILQIPYGILAERMKDRRLLCIIGGFFARSSWILIAFIPFLFPPEQRVSVVILLASFRIIMANLGGPAWAALQADIIPRSIRGKYYANRNVVLNICALLATFAANRLLGLEFPGNYQIIFVGAAILGITSTVLFIFIPFNSSGPKERTERDLSVGQQAKQFLTAVKKNRDFTNYTRSSFVWNFGVSFASSLFSVYFVQTLGGQPGSWAIITGASITTQILFQRYWGRLADMFGQKSVMSVTGLGAVSLPILWFFAPKSWFPIIINLISGIAWGGYNLAAFNLLLEITPDENRSLYVGVYNTLMGLSTTAGPLIGGFAAEVLGLRTIFLISAALRGAGLLMFHRSVSNAAGRSLGLSDLVPQRKDKESSHKA